MTPPVRTSSRTPRPPGGSPSARGGRQWRCPCRCPDPASPPPPTGARRTSTPPSPTKPPHPRQQATRGRASAISPYSAPNTAVFSESVNHLHIYIIIHSHYSLPTQFRIEITTGAGAGWWPAGVTRAGPVVSTWQHCCHSLLLSCDTVHCSLQPESAPDGAEKRWFAPCPLLAPAQHGEQEAAGVISSTTATTATCC